LVNRGLKHTTFLPQAEQPERVVSKKKSWIMFMSYSIRLAFISRLRMKRSPAEGDVLS
jgi:hypothetical protein